MLPCNEFSAFLLPHLKLAPSNHQPWHSRKQLAVQWVTNVKEFAFASRPKAGENSCNSWAGKGTLPFEAVAD
jgi:hypothetical protein